MTSYIFYYASLASRWCHSTRPPSLGDVANIVMKNHVKSPRNRIASLGEEIEKEDMRMEKKSWWISAQKTLSILCQHFSCTWLWCKDSWELYLLPIDYLLSGSRPMQCDNLQVQPWYLPGEGTFINDVMQLGGGAHTFVTLYTETHLSKRGI